MKKGFIFLLSTVYFLALSHSAYAISLCPTGYTGLCSIDPGKAIGSFVNFAYVIAIIAALLYLIWGGFKWLTSGGDKAALDQAREHVVAAIVGLIIVFVSYLILTLVGKFFLGASFNLNNITIPTFGQ